MKNFMKFMQFISASGILLLVNINIYLESFLAGLSFYNYESMKLKPGDDYQSGINLLISASVYLVIFFFSTCYLSRKEQVIVINPRNEYLGDTEDSGVDERDEREILVEYESS